MGRYQVKWIKVETPSFVVFLPDFAKISKIKNDYAIMKLENLLSSTSRIVRKKSKKVAKY